MPIGTFIMFVLVGTFTPGPNNITAMNNARKVGFRGSRPFILGVFSGFFLVALFCALFNLALGTILPGIQPILGALGALYMLYLAFKPFFHPKKNKISDPIGDHPYMAGFVLQFLNGKLLFYCLATLSSFVLPYYRDIPTLAAISLGLSFLAMLSVTVWSLFGVVFQKYFSEYELAVNVVMAVLLVYCAVIISGLDALL